MSACVPCHSACTTVTARSGRTPRDARAGRQVFEVRLSACDVLDDSISHALRVRACTILIGASTRRCGSDSGIRVQLERLSACDHIGDDAMALTEALKRSEPLGLLPRPSSTGHPRNMHSRSKCARQLCTSPRPPERSWTVWAKACQCTCRNKSLLRERFRANSGMPLGRNRTSACGLGTRVQNIVSRQSVGSDAMCAPVKAHDG